VLIGKTRLLAIFVVKDEHTFIIRTEKGLEPVM